MEKNSAAFMVFIDFTTAFDSIYWSALERLLEACGMPDALRQSSQRTVGRQHRFARHMASLRPSSFAQASSRGTHWPPRCSSS